MQFFRVFPVAALLMLFCALPGSAAPLYHLTDLGDLPGGLDQSSAFKISESGYVVGSGQVTGGPHGFVWSAASGLEDMGVFPGFNETTAFDVNGHGMAVGWAGGLTTHEYRPFLWTASGGFQNVGEDEGEAWAINDAGQVVGTDHKTAHAFVWSSATGLHDIGDLPDGDDGSVAYKINSVGQIVGGGGAATGFRAFLWTPTSPNGITGSMIDLGELPGGLDESLAASINDSGDVVGTSAVEGPPYGSYHAFLWTPTGGMQDLGTLSDDDQIIGAADINNLGQVVGQADDRAFLWTVADGMQDLNNMLDSSGADWVLRGAGGITDAGQIVGGGIGPNGALHAVLLTPVPEPGAIMLAICGAVGAAGLVRRRATIECDRVRRS